MADAGAEAAALEKAQTTLLGTKAELLVKSVGNSLSKD